VAGEAFRLLFDGGFCNTFVLPPAGTEPAVARAGNTLRVTVDYLDFASCDQVPRTFSVLAPGLPAGSYRLELVGQNAGSPDLLTLDSSVFHVLGHGVGAAPASIPAIGYPAMLVLAGGLILGSLGVHRWSRR
jgi:hypothetical protein